MGKCRWMVSINKDEYDYNLITKSSIISLSKQVEDQLRKLSRIIKQMENIVRLDNVMIAKEIIAGKDGKNGLLSQKRKKKLIKSLKTFLFDAVVSLKKLKRSVPKDLKSYENLQDMNLDNDVEPLLTELFVNE